MSHRILLVILVLALLAACAPAETPSTPPQGLIPALALPEDATLYGGGGGGGGGSGRQQGQGMTFDFNSSSSIEEIQRHFAEQLEAADWQARSKEGEQGALVSFWEVFDAVGRTWVAKLALEQSGDLAPYDYRVSVELLVP